MKLTVECTRMDKKRNADIYQEFNGVPLLDYSENYKPHINRYRIPKQRKNYRLNRKRSFGRPNKIQTETATDLLTQWFGLV